MATTQFFRKDGWVKSVLGPAIPGAQIWVCQQPANATSLPPSPLANVFSDPDGLVPLTLPAISDGFGHYNYYIAAGLYTEVIALNNVIQQVYPDQWFGLGNAGPGNPYTAGSNITIVGNVISAVIPAQVTVDLQTNSVDNTSQTKLNLKNGTNISIASDGVGGVTITNSATATPPASTIRWSIPKYDSLAGIWREAPTLPWSVQVGGIGAGQTNSFVQPTASVAPYAKVTSNATNTNASWYAGTTASSFTSVLKSFKVNAAVFSATNLRFWIGLTDFTNPGLGGLEFNNPTGNIVGFRFSSSADTHWVAYCSTSNVAFTATDTGISVDTTGALHTFEMRTTQGTPGTIRFYIDSTLVATISTTVPTATTGLAAIAYSESLATTTGTPGIGCNAFVEEIFQ